MLLDKSKSCFMDLNFASPNTRVCRHWWLIGDSEAWHHRARLMAVTSWLLNMLLCWLLWQMQMWHVDFHDICIDAEKNFLMTFPLRLITDMCSSTRGQWTLPFLASLKEILSCSHGVGVTSFHTLRLTRTRIYRIPSRWMCSLKFGILGMWVLVLSKLCQIY